MNWAPTKGPMVLGKVHHRRPRLFAYNYFIYPAGQTFGEKASGERPFAALRMTGAALRMTGVISKRLTRQGANVDKIDIIFVYTGRDSELYIF